MSLSHQDQMLVCVCEGWYIRFTYVGQWARVFEADCKLQSYISQYVYFSTGHDWLDLFFRCSFTFMFDLASHVSGWTICLLHLGMLFNECFSFVFHTWIVMNVSDSVMDENWLIWPCTSHTAASIRYGQCSPFLYIVKLACFWKLNWPTGTVVHLTPDLTHEGDNTNLKEPRTQSACYWAGEKPLHVLVSHTTERRG